MQTDCLVIWNKPHFSFVFSHFLLVLRTVIFYACNGMRAHETNTITINHRIKVRGKKDEAEKKFDILIILPTYANIINRLAIIVEHLHWISFSLFLFFFFCFVSLFFHEKKRSFTFFKQKKKLTTKWVEWSLNSIKLRRKKASKNNIYIFRNFFCLQSWMPRRCGGQVDFYRQHSGIVCYHKYLQHHCCGFLLLSSIAYFLIDAYFLLSLTRIR